MSPPFSSCVLGTCNIRYFHIKVFFASIRPLLITFAKKFYLHSGTYISHKLYAGYHPNGDFFEGVFVSAQKASCTC